MSVAGGDASFLRYIDQIYLAIPEIERVKGKCGGRPTFTGSRLTLEAIMASLDDTDEDLLVGYPRLTPFLLKCIRLVVAANPIAGR